MPLIDTCLFSDLFCSRALGQQREDETQADIGVVLNNSIPITELPQNSVVAQTLVEALNDTSNNFSVSISASSIQVICK